MQDDRLKYLMQRAVQGTMTAEEREEWHARLTGPEGPQVYDALHEMLPGEAEMPPLFSDKQAAALLERIHEKAQDINVNPASFRVRLKPLIIWPAASIILLLSVFSYRFFTGTGGAKNMAVADKVAGAAGEPVKSVVLTLSDGSRVTLDSAGRAIEQKGARAVNNGNGTLAYTGKQDVDGENELVFNTLATPRGRYYKVILSDGTKVWLNAASNLHYPTHFSDSLRRVELTGEAYFEVAGNAGSPFVVKAGTQTITVLGTAFNVKAYEDESYIKTTLVEGSILLDPQDGGNARLLKPGDQATLENGHLSIKKTDAKEDVAWMSDLFYFSNTDLQVVAHQLQRWYNIDVDFSSLPPEKLYGQLPRSTPLSQLLNAIEKTSNIKFKLTDNRLFVEK